jgi:hypothetical protein
MPWNYLIYWKKCVEADVLMKINNDLTKQYERELKLHWSDKQRILSKEVTYVPTKKLKHFWISDNNVSDNEYEEEYDDELEVMIDRLASYKPYTIFKLNKSKLKSSVIQIMMKFEY